jgi:hypothetical protein
LGIDGFQIVEQALHDGLIADGLQIRLIPGGFRTIDLSDTRHAVSMGENFAAVKGVNP